MESIATGIRDFINHLDPEAASAFKASFVHECFGEAVRCEYGDEVAAFVLSHVQAVYVMRDDAPRKGPQDARVEVLLHVYTDDSMVRSDLDARQESLKMKMFASGVRFDRMRAHQSTFGMRKRRPYAELVAAIAGDGKPARFDAALDMTPEQIDEIASRVDDPAVSAALERALRAYSA